MSLELDAFKNGRIQNVLSFLYISASNSDRSGKLVLWAMLEETLGQCLLNLYGISRPF